MEGENTLIRAKLTKEEYAEVRKEAIDRGLPVGEFVAQLIRAGRNCLELIEEKEELA